MEQKRLLMLYIVAALVGLPMAAAAADRGGAQTDRATTVQLPDAGAFPSLAGANAWLNSAPLSARELRGKVVLVDIWTYTCINWLRTEPYVRAWAKKYKDQGLVVIGVHSPEFEFEKNVDNVRDATKTMRIDYPVVVDSDHAIWRAFDNQYWPALYLIDAQGRIRYHHFGEGRYEETERAIQQLLADAGNRDVDRSLVSVDAQGAEVAADWDNLKSPENYLGYERTENFASSGGLAPGRSKAYAAPARLALNHWALSGDWTVDQGQSTVNKPGGRIAYRFHARDVHVVMGPAAPRSSARFRVLIDGKPPGDAHGSDVDAQGTGTVTRQRLYHLIRQGKQVSDRLFEIEFLDPGVEAYAFTFG
jgi:thiol-disulfide isomerase/thioredoxin